ncbi:MAG: DUF2634 domain-containing protein [Intestinimonas sp.]|jgi:hypothetical protein|nr:DUF2634 domain-containing protein [Intestinimonas sp.]
MTLAGTVSTDLKLSTDTETTRTYQLSEHKIQGFLDGADALRQSIRKVLNTERYEYPIYDLDYGIWFDDLVGKDRAYVKAELRRRIQETLLQDDRIKSVESFSFSVTDDEMLCTFDVTSIYGTVTASKGVTM